MATAVQSLNVILRRDQVQARTGISRSGIYQKIAVGEFPKPISLGPRAVGWLEADIDAWISSRIAVSTAKGGRGHA